MCTRSPAVVLFAALLIGAIETSAHSGGHGPITEKRAIEIGAEVVSDLSERDAGLGFGKLDASWSRVPRDAMKIHEKRKDYIVVSIRNKSEAKTLYVLMSPAGEVFDANFTGEFQGLENKAASRKKTE